MNSWIGNVIFILGAVASVAIRVPYEEISKEVAIAESRKGILERLLLFLVLTGMFVFPLLSFTPVLDFATYSLSMTSIVLGTLSMGLALWLFRMSHQDLGKNWSPSLEIRQRHELVTRGIYESIRHPMYASIFLLAISQIFLIANWIAGPALLVAFSAMFLSRLKSEERMMLDKFGSQYEEYRRQTKRLIPGVW